ncbi:MAG: imidazole glycerol phosphate synthase subunit HisH [Lachnospiraceae bacterium]|nr:imidazole glycerol phosphate synthase subunit HisH [Lachnospiraceae bacterium]
MTGIIDYDAGNVKSVEKALQFLGEDVTVTRDPQKLLEADRVVLPGVGAFGAAMERLENYGLSEVIHRITDRGTPFLGICLGLQLLFEESEESPGVKGLGILPGRIVRFPDGQKDSQASETNGARTGEDLNSEANGAFENEILKVPQIGWNDLHFPKESRLFKGVPEGSFVYFVHSYYLSAADFKDVAATTEYGVTVHATVEHDNVFACQFHPEKSDRVGLQILRNFISFT